MEPQLTKATLADVPLLNTLVNNAYRGEASRKGWTHEADLIDGDKRIDATSLASMIMNPHACIVIYKDQESTLSGCVYLEKQGPDMYLGMLSVLPTAQTKGIGKALMQTSEKIAEEVGCTRVFMSVISTRQELINWYKRRGYSDTGERQPFPAGDAFGVPRYPLDFAILEKRLETNERLNDAMQTSASSK